MNAERYDEHRRGVYATVRYMNAAKRFPFQDASFDNVFSCHMLEDCAYRAGRCPDPELLDNRPKECLFMEGYK